MFRYHFPPAALQNSVTEKELKKVNLTSSRKLSRKTEKGQQKTS